MIYEKLWLISIFFKYILIGVENRNQERKKEAYAKTKREKLSWAKKIWDTDAFMRSSREKKKQIEIDTKWLV
jgi:hypothetical protein